MISIYKLQFNFKSIFLIFVCFIVIGTIQNNVFKKNEDSKVAIWTILADVLDESVNNAESYQKYSDDESLYQFEARIRTLDEVVFALSPDFIPKYIGEGVNYQAPESELDILIRLQKDPKTIHTYTDICKNYLLEYRNSRTQSKKFETNKEEFLVMWSKLTKDTIQFQNNL